ncbi:hypothetical protein [Nocardia rhizosphaerae]|uniref:Uncharacterized protein n=1 Tax=Nocardia rhizosphaerae TaxID=1691571 RepID=A0ABV8LD94_9NOCA
MNTTDLSRVAEEYRESARRVLSYGRHARVFWKPNQRTVDEIAADNPDLVLAEHFATVPRDNQEARHGA